MDRATIDACKAYVGRSRHVEDPMSPVPARRLATLLGLSDMPGDGDPLPPTWHWAYLTEGVRPEDTGHDGHERLGLFLPPAPFSRRMWAAGDVTVHSPITLGVPARRGSVIESVDFKTGRTGDLCFVEVRHEITQQGALRVTEMQTIVYRDRGLPETALRGPDDPVPEGFRVYPDTQLFFYSAVTHNGHRIHWDRDFCRDVEGYPDLVVHGPLMATNLCDALRAGTGPCRFSFRAKAPVFAATPVRLNLGPAGDSREGRVERSDGVVSMEARYAAG